MLQRPRRNRASVAIRSMLRETTLAVRHLISPPFVQAGRDLEAPISSMPGQARLSIARPLDQASEAARLGVRGVALFPALENSLKDQRGRESQNPHGTLRRAMRELKKSVPELCLITDVALDPYASDGHDGVLIDGRIDNDETLPLLAAMAVAQARAGADLEAPSDMMDGRVAAIRHALDEAGLYRRRHLEPLRQVRLGVLQALPRGARFRAAWRRQENVPDGSRHVREGQREVALDEAEGADMLMVKPATIYADVIRFVRERTALPVAAYHVSGECTMLKAAAQNGWLNDDACSLETLLGPRRAGADLIFTDAALDAARLLERARNTGKP